MAGGESGMTGPIIFAEETPREQFTQEGVVVTMRANERTTGDTWWRRSRTDEKQGECHVERIAGYVRFGDTEMVEHVDESGFRDLRKWEDAFRRVNNGACHGGFLYRVTEGHKGGE